jgi:non-heme chloroperoxidase
MLMTLDATTQPEDITLPTGVTLQYYEQGDRQGLPVLLLHGYSDSWYSWSRVLPDLPDELRVIALTQRGHGGASRPESGYAMSDFAEDAIAVMDALGIEAAVVVGHSMGTLIATQLAGRAPERVLGLVLVAGFSTPMRENPNMMEFATGAIFPLTDPVDPLFAREFQQSTLAQPVPDAFLEAVVAESQRLPAQVWKDVMQGMLDHDLTSSFRQITQPALIIGGERDDIASEREQQALQQALPDARLIIYPGTGHAVHWEEPQRFARDLTTFVRSLSA